jgi:hypothetical protein
MVAPARTELHGSALVIDRALRTIEVATHSLRQRLLARELGRTLSPEHWKTSANDELGLAADDLRRHAEVARRNVG